MTNGIAIDGEFENAIDTARVKKLPPSSPPSA